MEPRVVRLADGQEMLLWGGDLYALEGDRFVMVRALGMNPEWQSECLPASRDGFFMVAKADRRLYEIRPGQEPIQHLPKVENIMYISPGPEGAILLKQGDNRLGDLGKLYFPAEEYYLRIQPELFEDEDPDYIYSLHWCGACGKLVAATPKRLWGAPADAVLKLPRYNAKTGRERRVASESSPSVARPEKRPAKPRQKDRKTAAPPKKPEIKIPADTPAGAALARLASIDLLANCGKPLDEPWAVSGPRSGTDFFRASVDPGWGGLRVSRVFTMVYWLKQNVPDAPRFALESRNRVGPSATELYRRLVRPRLSAVLRRLSPDEKHMLGQSFISSFSDLAVEAELISRGMPADLFSTIARAYEAGYAPCGWEGQYPQGRLIVY